MPESLPRIRRSWRRRLRLARLTSPLWHVKAWRYLQYLRHRPEGCTCSLSSIDYFDGMSSHPTYGCPLRRTCVSTYSGDRCGGCDGCIEDQIIYYRSGKTVEDRRD